MNNSNKRTLPYLDLADPYSARRKQQSVTDWVDGIFHHNYIHSGGITDPPMVIEQTMSDFCRGHPHAKVTLLTDFRYVILLTLISGPKIQSLVRWLRRRRWKSCGAWLPLERSITTMTTKLKIIQNLGGTTYKDKLIEKHSSYVGRFTCGNCSMLESKQHITESVNTWHLICHDWCAKFSVQYFRVIHS